MREMDSKMICCCFKSSLLTHITAPSRRLLLTPMLRALFLHSVRTERAPGCHLLGEPRRNGLGGLHPQQADLHVAGGPHQGEHRVGRISRIADLPGRGRRRRQCADHTSLRPGRAERGYAYYSGGVRGRVCYRSQQTGGPRRGEGGRLQVLSPSLRLGPRPTGV